MGHWGQYFYKFKGLVRSIIPSLHEGNNHSIFGRRLFKIDQSRREFAFEEGYATSSDVYSVINKIAKNAAEIPWILEKHTGDKIETITSGRFFDLIKNPNPDQTRRAYVQEGMIQLLTGGEAFFNSTVAAAFKRPSETQFLHPQLMEIETIFEGKFNRVKNYKYMIANTEFNIPVEEITHMKYCNPTEYGINSLHGLSPLVAAYIVMNGLKSSQTAEASILENQGVAGILSNEGEDVLLPKEAEKQQSLLDEKIKGSWNFGQVIQSMVKVKFTKLGLDPSQLKIIEGKVLKQRDLTNVYDVDSVLFNDKAASTFNNVTLANKNLHSGPVLNNMQLFMESYDKEVTQKFSAQDFPNGRSFYLVRLDTSNVAALQEDKSKKAQRSKAISETITKIMVSEMSDGQKIATLMISLEISEDEAKAIVNPK